MEAKSYQITWLQRDLKSRADGAENLGFYALRSKNFGLASHRGVSSPRDLHSMTTPRPLPSETKMADRHKRDGFFAVDRRTWARVCGLGLNRAVAYLVLARGTGKTNRESSWSVMAIENYTGISRGRAYDAVSALVEDGVLRRLRERTRPKYDLVPWHLVPGSDAQHSLGPSDQQLFDRISRGDVPTVGQDRARAERAVTQGWLIKAGEGQ